MGVTVSPTSIGIPLRTSRLLRKPKLSSPIEMFASARIGTDSSSSHMRVVLKARRSSKPSIARGATAADIPNGDSSKFEDSTSSSPDSPEYTSQLVVSGQMPSPSAVEIVTLTPRASDQPSTWCGTMVASIEKGDSSKLATKWLSTLHVPTPRSVATSIGKGVSLSVT